MKRPNLIGIDVSESSIKVLELSALNEITAYGSQSLTEGVVVNGLVCDKVAFAQTLEEILKNTKPRSLLADHSTLRAVLSLPESKLFTHFVPLPNSVKKSDISDYVRSDAEKVIPFKLAELYWDYHLVDTAGVRYAIFVGAPRKNIDNYVEAFSEAKIKPAIIEGELFSIGRALLPYETIKEAIIILDIGAHTTTIGIYHIDTIAHMSVTVPFGGEYFTKTISEKLKIPLTEAERMKREYGMNEDHKKSTVPNILLECLEHVVQSIVEARTYFESVHKVPVARMIVAGGSALIPQLPEFLAERCKLPTTIADPLAKLKRNTVFESSTPALFFSNVVGLGLLGADARNHGINLLTQYRYADGGADKEGLAIRDLRSMSDAYYFAYAYCRKGFKFISRLNSVLRPLLGKINVKLVGSVILVATTLTFLVIVILSYT